MNPMHTAPTNRAIRLHMPDGSSFPASLEIFCGADDSDVFGWVCLDEGQGPADWHDDVCWAENHDGKPSTKPVGWSQLEGRP